MKEHDIQFLSNYIKSSDRYDIGLSDEEKQEIIKALEFYLKYNTKAKITVIGGRQSGKTLNTVMEFCRQNNLSSRDLLKAVAIYQIFQAKSLSYGGEINE